MKEQEQVKGSLYIFNVLINVSLHALGLSRLCDHHQGFVLFFSAFISFSVVVGD